ASPTPPTANPAYAHAGAPPRASFGGAEGVVPRSEPALVAGGARSASAAFGVIVNVTFALAPSPIMTSRAASANPAALTTTVCFPGSTLWGSVAAAGGSASPSIVTRAASLGDRK